MNYRPLLIVSGVIWPGTKGRKLLLFADCMSSDNGQQ